MLMYVFGKVYAKFNAETNHRCIAGRERKNYRTIMATRTTDHDDFTRDVAAGRHDAGGSCLVVVVAVIGAHGAIVGRGRQLA